MLGTHEIMLIHHSDCGLMTFTDDELKQRLQAELGIKPSFALEAFRDVDADVRQSIARVRASPFLLFRDVVRGFVYDDERGGLREVYV
jgi:carbonic anhydrase